MNKKDFDKIANARMRQCKNVLTQRGTVYANSSDRLSNFKSAAAVLGCTPEQALRGFMTKHQVAIADFIDTLGTDHEMLNPVEWEEKIGDIINYHILLEALVTERMLRTVAADEPPLVRDKPCRKSELPSPVEKTPPRTKDHEPTPAGMSQEVPGTQNRTSTKRWKDAAGVPDSGVKVRIKEIGEPDGYYESRDILIGRTGTTVSMNINKTGTTLCGKILLDDNGIDWHAQGTVTFAYVKLEVLV